MKRTTLTWVVTVLVAVGTAGCKEDAPPPVLFPDSGVQCSNSADMTVLQGMRAATDAGPYEPALALALTCGGEPDCLGPLLQGDAGAGYACVDNCMAGLDPVTADLSDPCKGCFIVYGLFCAGARCLTDCLGGDPAQCDTCFSVECAPMFDYCVGF